MLGESDGISDEIGTGNSANENAEAEVGEIRDFIFDSDQVIDVDALEQFITDQQEQLVQEDEQEFNIDISSMLVGGRSAT